MPSGAEEDTGTPAGDPGYPNPAGGCPAGTIDGNMAFMPGANVCLPACDPTAADIVMACPQPATGTAPGICLLGDGSGSNDPCKMAGAACEVDGEFCLPNMMGADPTCNVQSGCLISCAGGGVCPDGMSCAGGLCGYD